MAFEDLHPLSKQYIEDLASHVVNGTHTKDIVRYSGSTEDPRSRIVQATAGTEPDYVIYMEGFSAGDALQRLVVQGFIKGSWVSSDTWEGTVEDSALDAYRAG
jgi:ABC-type taurine transport system ATPase subunit